MAQAQECILEKSILDHRKPGIIAKVCAQVSEYYTAALKKMEASNRENKVEPISESVGDKRSRAWVKYIDFKSVYYKVCEVQEETHVPIRLVDNFNQNPTGHRLSVPGH